MLIKPVPHIISNSTIDIPAHWQLLDWPHSWFLIREHQIKALRRVILWYRWTIYVDRGERELWDERFVRHELV